MNKKTVIKPENFCEWLKGIDIETPRQLARAADISVQAATRILRGGAGPKASTLLHLGLQIVYIPVEAAK